MNKNDIIELQIQDLTEDGDGVGRYCGCAFFVKGSLPGDSIQARIMKLKKHYGYARLLKILKPSPFRVEPACPQARTCGGCQLQAMAYENQLQFKEEKVKNHLQRLGKFSAFSVMPILGMENPWHYRNKEQLPVGKTAQGETVMGFYAKHSHRIVEHEACMIGTPEQDQVVRAVRQYMTECNVQPYDEETGTGLVRHILIRRSFSTKSLLVCLVINGERLPAVNRLMEFLLEVPDMTSISCNINMERTNVILGDKMVQIYGPTYILDEIGGLVFRISAQSFFQVNPVQTEKLYETVLEFADLKGGELVWDLYCGIGTISLFLAQKAHYVRGVEIVPRAVEDARENAILNSVENVRFYAGQAEEVLPRLYNEEKIRADVMVVDPPRKGCDKALLDTMLQMSPDRIVYVSCDSATLARDLRYLAEGGYQLEKVRPVDMFPWTTHVECVVLITRNI